MFRKSLIKRSRFLFAGSPEARLFGTFGNLRHLRKKRVEQKKGRETGWKFDETRWWQLKYFWNFHPYLLGQDEPILRIIFFKGVIQPPTWEIGAYLCAWMIFGSSEVGFCFVTVG